MDEHLEIELDLKNPQARDLLDKAITEIIEMGSKQISLEKLDCIVACSKTIFELLQVSRTEHVSADQFLPGLVFVIIKANPPLLHSNINYISGYSNPRRSRSGEAGYYFTNLCCAVTFIENLTSESLNIKDEDFRRYINGEAVPAGSLEQSAYLCEPLRIVYSNAAMIDDLIKKQTKFESEVQELKEKMTEFREGMMKKIDAHLKPIKIPSYNVDPDIDPKFIPSALRERILKERSYREGILVEIDNNISTCNSYQEEEATNDNFSPDDEKIDAILKDQSSISNLPEPLQPELI